MTSPVSIADGLKRVTSQGEAEERFLEGIEKSSDEKQIGGELEMRLKQFGRPLSRFNGQLFFGGLHKDINVRNRIILDQAGNPARIHGKPQEGAAHLIYESFGINQRTIVAVQGMEKGAFHWEPAMGPEFAGSVGSSVDDLIGKMTWAIETVRRVAGQMNHDVFFTGFDQDYAEAADFTPRNRGEAWEHFARQFTEQIGLAIRHVHYGSASFQLTVNSGKDRFHDIKSILLLAEALVALQYNNAQRLSAINLCATHFAAQFEPIVEAWKAPTVEDSVRHVMNRVWNLPIPFFNPDPTNLENYELTAKSANGLPRTVGESVASGKYSFQDLNQAMGFYHGAAASRKLDTGFHEVRYPDSTDSTDTMKLIANFIYDAVYRDFGRIFLESASFMTADDIKILHDAARHWTRSGVWDRCISSGDTIRDVVKHAFGDGHFKNLPKHPSSVSATNAGREATRRRASGPPANDGAVIELSAMPAVPARGVGDDGYTDEGLAAPPRQAILTGAAGAGLIVMSGAKSTYALRS